MRNLITGKCRLLILLAGLLCLLCGCAVREEKTQKVKDLSYTIVDEEDIPQALLDTIEEKKAAECKLTYETDDALYVVHGYGEQETGGYSIAVKEFYLTGNAVCIDTELIGPAGNEHPAKSPSFPYIVLKTERQNTNVVFE